MLLKLRPYQFQLIQDVHKSLRTNKRVIAVMATGGGKTACFAWMADASQKKGSVVWFIVHRIELLKQTIDTFEKFNIPLKTVHIGMVSSFANHPEKYQKPDLIIFDECQHSMAATWLKIINNNPDVYIIGLTATPARLSGRPLGDIYTDIVVGADTAALIESGHLAPYRYYSFNKIDLSGLKKRSGDYIPEDAEQIMMDRAVYGDTIENYKKLADGKQTVCFCTTIKHSQSVAQSFVDAGYNARHFDGNTPSDERDQIIKDFRSGKIQILTNCNLISEGFDLDAIDCVIQLRPTVSLVLYLQCIGRCLRPKQGKTAVIIDQVGNHINFGLPDDDREWSLSSAVKPSARFDTEGKLIVTQCLKCYGTFKRASVCPYCGAPVEPTREEIKQIESVRLEEIKQRKESNMERYRAKTAERVKDGGIESCGSLFECQQWCKANGRSAGFGYIYWTKLRK